MDTYSEAYRHQCEVRTCIKMSVEYGRQVLREHLEGCLAKRGQKATDVLKKDIAEQWRLGNRGEHNDWRG